MTENNQPNLNTPQDLPVPGTIQQPTLTSYNSHGSNCASCQHLASSSENFRIRDRNSTMSPVRRFFTLFVTFDLLLTCLIWLICLVLTGEYNFYNVINKEIVHYCIRTSSFDIVMASGARFVILLLFYALLRIDHWFIVALTTASTCFFLVAKVCLFDWSTTSNQVLQVMLILSSFILSWAEAWLLDIRVIPHEKRMENVPPDYDERAPLLRNYPNIHSRLDALSESIVSFYSPAESSEDSGDESARPPRKHRAEKPCSTNENYHTKGEEILEAAWQLLNNDQWVFEKDTPEGDSIYSQKIGKGHKIFRLTGTLNIPSTALQELLFNKIEDFPKWNPTIKEAKIVQVLDSCTDITSQISSEAGLNGLITCREFVTLRFCKPKYGHLIIASASITWPRLFSEYIRGENGPGCWAIKSISEDSCEVQWLLNTKINGWLPQYAIDFALAGVMIENMAHLRKFTNSSVQKQINNKENLPNENIN